MSDKSETAFLRGERIYLRDVQLADVNENYHRWMNDPEVTRYLESRFYPNTLEALREYVSCRRGDHNSVFFAIVLNEGDRHIGNIKLGSINWIHRLADVGIIIGEKDCWGKGYATEAIRLIARHSFNTMNLHKLIAGVYGVNAGSSHAFLKAGFVREGLYKQHYFCEGKYMDSEMLGLLATGNDAAAR